MKKLLLLSAVVVAVLAASSQARADVSFSISLGHGHHHAPVVVAPPPVVYDSHHDAAPLHSRGYAQHHGNRHSDYGHRDVRHDAGRRPSHGIAVSRHGQHAGTESARGAWGRQH